jgi:hypothetical protein
MDFLRGSIMSRAYRIKVSESLRRVIRASDHVSTRLEVLEILPPEDTAALLEAELLRRGFERKGEVLVRENDGVRVEVEPESGTVTVRAEAADGVEIGGEREAWSYQERGAHRKSTEQALRKQLQDDLEKQVRQKNQQLQKEVTDRLERQLGDLRRELDQVVNRVTAEALKRKAAQIGQIKELTEDPQSGSMTIVLEV